MRPESKILFMMSGSIACAKATALISAWKKAGHDVRVAATASVSQFVGRATLEGLSGAPVFDDTFEPGRAMDHIELARWADLVVVCPASANLLARFATGIADDAVSTLWQATWARGAPAFVAPAMNTHMWDYPATRENVKRLQSWGVHVLPTASGDLACGETGAGRLLEPEDIRARIEGLLEADQVGSGGIGRGRRVLVTGGGTREAIDSVRYIGNHSTGRTAAVLAEELAARGFEVTWLGGAGAVVPEGDVHRERYVSFGDLAAKLEELLGTHRFDGVVHAAAVSDFSVARETGGEPAGKLASGEGLTLSLVPNPKLLGQLRDWSCHPDLAVVGFKLTVGADEAGARRAVDRLFANASCDLVVHNDFQDIAPGRHAYDVHDAAGGVRRAADTRDLAAVLAGRLAAAPARTVEDGPDDADSRRPQQEPCA